MKMHFKRHLPTILSAVASAGVIFTAISASKAALKAEKKDTIKEKVVCYIPTGAVVVGTICCIGGSNHLNRKQQASLIGMYTMLEHRFKKYTNKVKEHHGAEAHNQIMDEIIKEECNPPDMWLPNLVGYSVLVPNNLSEEEVTRTFYDKFSKRYFESTLSKVLEAEATLNRDYALGGELELNDFYDNLGIARIPEEEYGNSVWEVESGLYWIDFNHRVETLFDGMEVIVIEMPFEPWPQEMQDL